MAQHHVVRIATNSDASSLEMGIPDVVLLFVVDRAIHLHNQAQCWAPKVSDVAIHGLLSSELHTQGLASRECPQGSFSRRGTAPHLACLVTLPLRHATFVPQSHGIDTTDEGVNCTQRSCLDSCYPRRAPLLSGRGRTKRIQRGNCFKGQLPMQ